MIVNEVQEDNSYTQTQTDRHARTWSRLPKLSHSKILVRCV